MPARSVAPLTDRQPLEKLSHAIGEVTSADRPSAWMADVGGAENNTMEIRYFFGEFLRLELGTKWYRVSDFVDWKLIAKYRFTGGAFVNNGSVTGPGN